MNKLHNFLSELSTSNKYITSEVDKIQSLSNKVSESIKICQGNCDEALHAVKETGSLNDEEQVFFSRLKHSEKEFLMAIQKWEDIQADYQALARNGKSASNWSQADFLKKLENQMKTFGLSIQAEFLNPIVYQAKISFAADKFVVISCDVSSNTYHLQVVQPSHRNCEKMQKLLLETGDIVGFLCHIRAFFKQLT